MKRLFTYIPLLALAVACETMYGPVQTPIAADKTDGIEVNVTETKDESVTFTLTPKEESAYYSYMVMQADEPTEVDADNLYKGAYKGGEGVVKIGSFKWTAKETSSTVTVSKLLPNTSYQIYAVAGSPMGFTGEVANVSFKTSDTVCPVLEDFEAADSVLTLVFSEAVIRGEGALTAGVYAMNSAEIEEGKAVGTVPVKDENIAISGSTVTVTVADLPAGAFYALNYPEGAFTDPSKNKAAGLESSVEYSSDTDWEAAYDGVGGRNATNTFTLGQIEAEKYSSSKAPAFLLSFDSEYGYGYTYGNADGEAVYTFGNKTTSYALTGKVDYAYVAQYGGVVLQLPTSGDPGNSVEITIAEGAFEDFYGNLNAEWTDELLYSYGYTLADIVGQYNFVAPENVSQKYVQSTLTIVESNNPEEGNVMLTSFAGYPCMAPIYGTFNTDAGTLSFAHGQIFIQTKQGADVVWLVFYTYSGKGVTLSVPEAGKLNNPSDYFGSVIAINGTLTAYNALYLDFEAERVVAESSAAVQSNDYVSFPSFEGGRLEVEIKKF